MKLVANLSKNNGLTVKSTKILEQNHALFHNELFSLLKQLLVFDWILVETEHMILKDEVIIQSKLLIMGWKLIQIKIKLVIMSISVK